jgi:chromatin remodeling complex protein RSC6
MPKAAAPKSAKPAAKPANAAFLKPLTPSPELAAIVGAAPLPRTEVIKKAWEYIKQHGLQDAADKRMINADAKLKPIFGKPQVSMFEMTKLLNAHLK